MNYGLGKCDKANEGVVMATKNEHSSTYGSYTRFICKSGAWRKASDIEKDFYNSNKDQGKDGEIWTGPITGNKYKYDEKLAMWIKADALDVTSGNACTSKKVGNMAEDSYEVIYYCSSNGWTKMPNGWSWDVPKETRLNPKIKYGTMIDSRDGKTYKIVTIGSGKNERIWMAENLNYYNNSALSVKNRSWCYGKSNGLDSSTCDVTGRLYTWAAAIDSAKLYKDKAIDCGFGKLCSLPDTVYGICPSGWYLPQKEDWDALLSAVNSQSYAGKALKSQTG